MKRRMKIRNQLSSVFIVDMQAKEKSQATMKTKCYKTEETAEDDDNEEFEMRDSIVLHVHN